MDGDAYRDMSHAEIQQLVWRKVAEFADYATVEQRLQSNKIADVFYQVGRITVIVEVKTILRQSLIDDAWRKYRGACDYLVIASPPRLVVSDQAQLIPSWEDERIARVGIWWVSWQGITEIRPACRLNVRTPGHVVHMSRASSPFTAIGTPPCTAD